VLSGLRDCADVTPYWTELKRWPTDRLERLGHGLAAVTDRRWSHDSVLDRVERLLALTPSAERAAAAARVALAGSDARARRMAALLAQGQEAEVLLPLLRDLPAGARATELGACLLHELVLRDVSVAPVAEPWRRRLAGHPLAHLPLHPLPAESRLPLPRYSEHGQAHAMPSGGSADLIMSPGVVPVAERQTTPADATAPVTTWLTESNGHAEAAVFTLAEPLAPAGVGIRTLESLGLSCLAGDGLALRPATLPEVVAVLFGAAANGGAYDHGQGGAYGRSATWRSVAALAGGTHEGAAWWLFDAANDWFRRIAWDLGVVCLRPGGRGLAVLAATDED
jgi:hypothetical protein